LSQTVEEPQTVDHSQTVDAGKILARPVPIKKPNRRSWMGAVLFTGLLLGLIIMSIEAVAGDFAFVVLAAVAIVVYFFHRIFPGGEFFAILLANFIGIYATIFVLFAEGNFPTVHPVAKAVGFILPLAAFLGGAWWRRRKIRTIVMFQRLKVAHQFSRIFFWLLPMTAIGALTFLLPDRHISATLVTEAFLLAMFAIAGVVLFVSRDIAIFLLDTGLLFEGFFQQAARLVVPAFAFLTFYSLLVIVFAAFYSILDRFSDIPHFVIEGRSRDIVFSESLYFSLVTLSTVGYGDIQPHSGIARMMAAIQIVLGVLLLLFGFSAIIGYRTEHHDRSES